MGGEVAGMAVMPAHPCHCRFCILFLWEWVYWQWEGWWQKSGLVRTLQKKGPVTVRGKATEGNMLGGMALGTGETWDNVGGGGIADVEGPAGGGGAADMEGPARGGGWQMWRGQQEGEELMWRSQQESYAVQDWP